jgi:hypothetical protein
MTMYSLDEAVLMILAQSPMSCQDPFRNTFLVPEEESKVLFAAKHATPRPLCLAFYFHLYNIFFSIPFLFEFSTSKCHSLPRRHTSHSTNALIKPFPTYISKLACVKNGMVCGRKADDHHSQRTISYREPSHDRKSRPQLSVDGMPLISQTRMLPSSIVSRAARKYFDTVEL